MKNQYFGDINDYLKYGILRIIAAETALRITVCWMLTGSDGRPDGKKTRYLSDPSAWRHFDPPLFDALKRAIESGQRCIDIAEDGALLPTQSFQSEILPDELVLRHDYFCRLEEIASPCDLVFFDPDNGMEVKSKKKGRRNSAKYLYWDEVQRISGMGKSMVVFQHFARMRRELFIRDLKARFESETHAEWVGAMVSPNVVFFVVSAPSHELSLRSACERVKEKWYPHLRLIADLPS